MRDKGLSTGLRSSFAILVVSLFMMGIGASAQEAVVHNFDDFDGQQPIAGLIIDHSGNLYGTTFYGGANGDGAVFELTPQSGGGWVETVLFSFNDLGNDGFWPNSRLVFDASGNLYGTTFFGGTFGVGTVYELSPTTGGNWTGKTIHSFDNRGGDGTWPHASLIVDASGNLYGTTAGGGAAGDGIVYELIPAGDGTFTEKVLHSFNGTNGASPYSSLVLDASGNLYGMTAYGGTSTACTAGCGTVFELSPATGGHWGEKVLRSFNNTDGANPYGNLIFGTNGNLYGVTSQGGAGNDGLVFELAPTTGGSWGEKILHTFNSPGDGINPWAPLIFDGAGNLYGTTGSGGEGGQGTVFGLSPTTSGPWKERVLYNFNTRDGNGYGPVPGVVFDGAGNLYGATESGGAYGNGIIFEITP
jgi:uncharacterized repeat protein (TIGR03803 family)